MDQKQPHTYHVDVPMKQPLMQQATLMQAGVHSRHAVRIKSRPVLSNRQWAPDVKTCWRSRFCLDFQGASCSARTERPAIRIRPIIDKILERQNSANELLLEALNMDGSGDEARRKREHRRVTRCNSVRGLGTFNSGWSSLR